MSKKLIVFIFILIALTVVYAKTKTPKPNVISIATPIPPTPIISLLPQSSLSFTPETIYAKPGQNNQVNIQLNWQGKYPTGAQLELAYDPAILTKITLGPGSLFPNPNILLNNIDEETGRFSYSLSHTPNKEPRQTSGVAAILNFTVKENILQKETAIYFLPKTTIISQESTIPLKIAYGLKIFINPQPLASESSSLKNNFL